MDTKTAAEVVGYDDVDVHLICRTEQGKVFAKWHPGKQEVPELGEIGVVTQAKNGVWHWLTLKPSVKSMADKVRRDWLMKNAVRASI